jgi:predicted MFS family arabinose efflux permease
VAWWTWLAKTLPHDAEAGGGMMVAIVQLALASGATVGGILFDGLGYRATFGASATVLLVAAVLAARAARRSA